MLLPQAVSLIRAFVQASASSTQGVPGSSSAVATGLGSHATAYPSPGVPWPRARGGYRSCSEIAPRHPTDLRRFRRRHLGAPGTRKGRGREGAPPQLSPARGSAPTSAGALDLGSSRLEAGCQSPCRRFCPASWSWGPLSPGSSVVASGQR